MATPKIVWNSQTWTFPGPIDNPVPVPLLGLVHTESKSRNRDSWEEALFSMSGQSVLWG